MKYGDSEFSPFDGARPYIEPQYLKGDASGELRGPLKRSAVPDGVEINPAPPPNQAPHQVANAILELLQKRRRKNSHIQLFLQLRHTQRSNLVINLSGPLSINQRSWQGSLKDLEQKAN